MENNFFNYAALISMGFEDSLSKYVAGLRNKDLFTSAFEDGSSVSDISIFERLSIAIRSYPTQGYNQMLLLANDDDLKPVLESISARFESEMERRNTPGWTTPGNKYIEKVTINSSPINIWSSLPAHCDINIAVLDGTVLFDDFMLDDFIASSLKTTDLNLSSKCLLEIKNEKDWKTLVSLYSQSVYFKGSPQDDWNFEYYIPDWKKFSTEYNLVFISISAYLKIAYRKILIDEKKTMLAGWHPASIVWI